MLCFQVLMHISPCKSFSSSVFNRVIWLLVSTWSTEAILKNLSIFNSFILHLYTKKMFCFLSTVYWWTNSFKSCCLSGKMKIKKLKTFTFIGFIIKPAPYINPGSKNMSSNCPQYSCNVSNSKWMSRRSTNMKHVTSYYALQ